MAISIVQEYAESLAALSGNDFQAEVCARLQSVVLDFQTVPAKPYGDAGLDAFSHGGKRGYCCYGLEHDQFKTNSARVKAVVDKFKSDLRRLFELESKNKKLVCTKNPEIVKILPKGQRITHIVLLVNWFESHRVLSPILTAAAEYKATSKCSYVDPAVTVIVVGPKDLASRYVVDELTINRARQRAFIQSVQQAAQQVAIEDYRNFDRKMVLLREIRPDQVPAINSLSDQFLANWRMALAFERKLHETLPVVHGALEDGRRMIVTRISELMLASDRPWEELGRAEELAKEILGQEFGRQYGALVGIVSSGEIARLIDECTIGWQKPGVAHA
jgi:hypothetical protein